MGKYIKLYLLSMSEQKEKSMLEEIDAQMGELQQEDLSKLILDRCKCATLTKDVKEKIESFPNLEVLTLNGVGLTSLKNFPTNKSLKMLELSDNKISGGLEFLSELTNLVSINISGNQLESFEALASLAKLTEIVSIDMFGNPITEKEN